MYGVWVERVSLFFYCVIAMLALALVVAILGMLGVTPSGTAADWCAAIGTVGTLIGTIYLATADRRATNTRALEHAALTARSLYFRLLHVQAALENVSAWLDHAIKVDQHLAGFVRCGELLEKERRWNVEELRPLIIWPNNAARILASVSDEIASIIQMLLSAEENAKLEPLNKRREFAKDVGDSVKNAAIGLTYAIQVIEPFNDSIDVDIKD